MRHCTDSPARAGSGPSGAEPRTTGARYYILTQAGQSQLGQEHDQWARLSGAVDRIMGLA